MTFLKNLFMLNAKDYLEIVVDLYINVVVFIVAAALCAASFIINHHKAYTFKIIRQLLRRGATDEENGKTLKDLHLDNSRYLKSALTKKGQLASVIKRADYVEPTYEEYVALMKEKKQQQILKISNQWNVSVYLIISHK